MIFLWRFFHTHSRGFTAFQDTRKFWFEIISLATSLSILALLACLARHSQSDWCFQLLTRILDGFFEFLVLSVNEIDPSQFSCFSDGAFHSTIFDSPSAWRAFPLTSRALAMDVSCFLVNLSPEHIYPSGAFSSNRVNCVKPVQETDKSRDPSIFQ